MEELSTIVKIPNYDAIVIVFRCSSFFIGEVNSKNNAP